MCDQPHRKAEVAVEFAHPLAVAPRKVVVDRHHVDALSGECVEVHRRRSDERLAFACAHLGDAPLMQADPAHELHIEMPHAEHPPRRLAHDRKRLRQNLLHRLPRCQLLTEAPRSARQLVIREIRHRRFERVDLIDHCAVACDLLFVVVAEESFQNRRYSEQVLSRS